MNLRDLKPSGGSTRRHKRIGRGIGSGSGKTAGRGHKGKGSRSGGNSPPGYEGGQMPLKRRIPKRGFRRLQKDARRRDRFAAINLERLADFADGATVDSAALAERGIVAAGMKIKILGGGELTVKLNVRADAFSGRARQKIESAGGTAQVPGAATAN
ncbi:MAG: 50S ribosomal protein L15 [Candidatus Binataceae bacterium]